MRDVLLQGLGVDEYVILIHHNKKSLSTLLISGWKTDGALVRPNDINRYLSIAPLAGRDRLQRRLECTR